MGSRGAFLNCPVAGCPEGRTTAIMLMCRRHWRQVPKELRDRVWETWRRRQAATGLDVHDAAVEAHEEAKDAAIAAVEQREAGPADAV